MGTGKQGAIGAVLCLDFGRAPLLVGSNGAVAPPANPTPTRKSSSCPCATIQAYLLSNLVEVDGSQHNRDARLVLELAGMQL